MEYRGHIREIIPYDFQAHSGGYGFIRRESDKKSIFFLLTWADYTNVKVGDYVKFDVAYDEKNRISAQPVSRDTDRLAKNIKTVINENGLKTSRKKIPVPGVKVINSNITEAYKYLDEIQRQFGLNKDMQPSLMLTTISDWISQLLDLNTKFNEHEAVRELLINRNILPRPKQITALEELQLMLRKMNYEQRGRYYGVRGEQIVQAKLEQHHLQFIQNATLPEFDNEGNVVGATEIDFIVVSMFGIHVIEVKNYGANKNSEQKLTIKKDGQWSRIGSNQENVTNQNDIHIAAVEGVLYGNKKLNQIALEKLLAVPIYVIPNEIVEIDNYSTEAIVRIGLLYDTIAQDVRKSRQVILSATEIKQILAVLTDAVADNREFQYFLPNEDFLADADALYERYQLAQIIYQNIDTIYS